MSGASVPDPPGVAITFLGQTPCFVVACRPVAVCRATPPFGRTWPGLSPPPSRSSSAPPCRFFRQRRLVRPIGSSCGQRSEFGAPSILAASISALGVFDPRVRLTPAASCLSPAAAARSFVRCGPSLFTLNNRHRLPLARQRGAHDHPCRRRLRRRLNFRHALLRHIDVGELTSGLERISPGVGGVPREHHSFRGGLLVLLAAVIETLGTGDAGRFPIFRRRRDRARRRRRACRGAACAISAASATRRPWAISALTMTRASGL